MEAPAVNTCDRVIRFTLEAQCLNIMVMKEKDGCVRVLLYIMFTFYLCFSVGLIISLHCPLPTYYILCVTGALKYSNHIKGSYKQKGTQTWWIEWSVKRLRFVSRKLFVFGMYSLRWRRQLVATSLGLFCGGCCKGSCLKSQTVGECK